MTRFGALGGTLMATAAWVAAGPGADANTFYVSASAGSNAHSGTSAAAPLATLQYAEGLTHPGDTVLIMNGTYTNDAPGDNVLFVDRSGTATAPITYKALAGQHPVLKVANSWAAVRISADYIVIDGLEIIGNAASLSTRYAMSQSRNLSNPVTNGDGLDIDQPAPNVTPHHVTIQNMVIHDVPGDGIAADYADYVTIQNNVVYNTSKFSPYGDSAISVYEATGIDAVTGYKIKILHNTTFDNEELVPCVCRNYETISDGNGIIIDDNTHAQGDHVAYGGRTLVAFNVSFDNGGSGIHAYSSQHVDILNNTTYGDELIATPDEGEIFSDSGADVKILDNILDAASGHVITGGIRNAVSVSEDYNLLWNISGALRPPTKIGPHDQLANPLFTSPATGNFTLQGSSPARSTGSAPAQAAGDRGAE